ncbi:MAG: hypothetical protein KGJ80_13820 [Chloroflexota bacterium]|nr:hypothetical protein [Chloroflexota bacterium]
MVKPRVGSLFLILGFIMKYLTLLVVAVLVVSCSQVATSGLTAKPSATTTIPIRAIYLVQDPGQLDTSDLQAHPQVIVTDTFSDLEQHARTRVALWIDKNATTLIKGDWLDQPPQMYYPLVLVGYNDTPYSFKYILRICCLAGPAGIDWSTQVLEPGFSAIQREGANGLISGSSFVQGYKQTPRVQDILNITDALLDGTLKPTPTAIITASTPTPPPPVKP